MNIKTANRLQQLRKQHGYSQEELASLLNVSRQAVSKWECAEASPDTDNLIAIAELYNVSIDELINGKTTKSENTNIASCHPKQPDNSKLTNRQKIILSIVSGSTVIIATAIYLTIGFCLNLWHPAWIIFMLIPITSSCVEAIMQHNASHFALPVLIAAVYMCVGFLTGLWHPCWVMFLIIPIYYVIVDAVNLNKSKNNK